MGKSRRFCNIFYNLIFFFLKNETKISIPLQFQLKQVKLRSKIRIEEGRAKPIDLLAKYIDAEDDDLVVEMHEPYTYLNGLTIRDLEDLLVDIEIYKSFETGDAVEFWKEMAIVTDDELKKLQKMDKNSRGMFYFKF